MRTVILILIYLSISGFVSDLEPGLRVIVAPNKDDLQLPIKGWRLDFKFKVPPEPEGNWDANKQTVYTYGQVDFDRYGEKGEYKISDYDCNQIVPQVMIGNCSATNDSNFKPSYEIFDNWVIKASYFWYGDNTPYALCGNIVPVSPGEEISTNITYDSASGQITATISGSGGTSSIIIDRPFPNDSTLFTSWKDFFMKASKASGTDNVYASPLLTVETHQLDEETVCSMLPFNVESVFIPGIKWEHSDYKVFRDGDFDCADGLANELAVLNFK